MQINKLMESFIRKEHAIIADFMDIQEFQNYQPLLDRI
jgi:hypothetical protein